MIEQRNGLLPPGRSAGGAGGALGGPPAPALLDGQRHYLEQQVRGVEVMVDRIVDQAPRMPLDLLERFARALNHGERAAIARVTQLEEAFEDR